MNNNSQEILRRVTQNDPSLTELRLVGYNVGDGVYDGQFYSNNRDDYPTLGAAIANNTHMESLEVTLSNRLPLTVADRGFYDGLQHNSSINKLVLHFNIVGVGHEILKACQTNGNLTYLGIYYANLQNGGERIIVDTLRCC